MAYKNKKKNKKHQSEIRAKLNRFKHQRKKMMYERKHPPLSREEEIKNILRERGMI